MHDIIGDIFFNSEEELLGNPYCRSIVKVILVALNEIKCEEDMQKSYFLFKKVIPTSNYYYIQINKDWSIIFELFDKKIYDVELVHHKEKSIINFINDYRRKIL